MSWPTGTRHPRYKDGRSAHPLYGIWKQMIQRCTNPRASNFDAYGGRGIQVCDRWRGDFWAFVTDMGDRPAGHELDRIDNDGDYAPGNTRWATRSEQLLNRRPPGRCGRGHQLTNSGVGCIECNRLRKREWYRANRSNQKALES